MPRLAVIALAGFAALALTACEAGTEPASSGSATATQSAGPAAASSAPTPSPSATIPVDWERIDVGERQSYSVVTLPLAEWDVRVDWPQDEEGTDLAEYLEDNPGIGVLTNAGIFSESLAPGGLLVADGEELHALNLADGWGNFHLKPNAVFEIREDGSAAVVDSTLYDPAGVMQATQSGPALLLDGEVHPEFREGSENTALRTGVGVSPDGETVYLAITRVPANLWDFALLFRDELGVEDALYLDGQISQLWVSGQPEPTSFLGPYAGVIAAYPR